MAKRRIRKAGKGFMVSLNLIVALLFIFSCYSYIFNPNTFWFLGFLPLAALYFLLAIFCFIIFWFFVKPIFVTINIVTLLICLNPVQHLFAIHSAHKFRVAKNAGSLRVMSWNVEHFQILKYKNNPRLKKRKCLT